MQWRLWLSALVVALLAAGCFSSGVTLRDNSVSLHAVPELSDDGDHMYVTVRAVARDGSPADLEGLEVHGLTADGRTVPVTVTTPVDAVTDPLDDDSTTFSIDIAELLAKGITRLELVLGSVVLTIDISTLIDEEPEPEPGPDPDPDPDPTPDPDPDPDPEPEPGPEPDPDPDPEPTPTREVRTLRAGTSQATPAYIIRSGRPGPTVMVVGGMHGSETAGWMAADEITEWTIDRGTLVVVPRANRPAIERSRRTGPDGLDLNRQFPRGSTPTTALAREIWGLVEEFRPVALMDLHEGWGLRILGHRFSDGTLSVGQTIIRHPVKDANSFANAAAKYVGDYHVSAPGQKNYRFLVIGPPVDRSLARKAGADLGIPAFIVEPSQHQTTLATRIRWHKAFVEQLLKWYGLVDESRVIVPKYYNNRAAVFGPAVFPTTGKTATVAA